MNAPATPKRPFFRQLGLLSDASAEVLGLLEMGLNSEACERVGIHTSKKGMTILLNGRSLCSGRTVRECMERLDSMKKDAQTK